MALRRVSPRVVFFVSGTETYLQDLEGEGGMPGFNVGSGGDDSGSLGETPQFPL